MTVDAPCVTLLDGFAVHAFAADSRSPVSDLPHAVERLVAHLCLSGSPPRSALAGQLWPDVSEGRAHGSLRSALWRLQKAVPGLVLVSRDHLNLAAGVRVDVHELGRWAKRARDLRSPLDDVDVPIAGLRGELLPGWYDDWVLLERERIRQLRLHALETVAERLMAAERFETRWRSRTPQSMPSRCARARNGPSSAYTWRRGTSPRPFEPSSSSGRSSRTSSAWRRVIT